MNFLYIQVQQVVIKKKKSCHHREQNGKIRGNDIDNNLNKIAWKYNAIKVNAVCL